MMGEGWVVGLRDGRQRQLDRRNGLEGRRACLGEMGKFFDRFRGYGMER
jgi:hypothetical protein